MGNVSATGGSAIIVPAGAGAGVLAPEPPNEKPPPPGAGAGVLPPEPPNAKPPPPGAGEGALKLKAIVKKK